MNTDKPAETQDADLVVENPWRFLRKFTTARIGLGRAGVSQPTKHHLDFQLAHARAKDAVHSELNIEKLQQDLKNNGYQSSLLKSQAGERPVYLQRPDLGRKLDQQSERKLAALRADNDKSCDVAFIIADGLSAMAVQRHAVPFLNAIIPRLKRDNWRLAPLTLVQQGRVAISDHIGVLLNARQAVILIGERPGLSSPDSLGIYLTYDPQIGKTDADRNCISNVRQEGLSYESAAHKLFYLISEARRRKLSGVHLKDEAGMMENLTAEKTTYASNFLIDQES